MTPPVELVLDFLTHLVHKGLGHSALCTAKTALTHAVTFNNSRHSVASHPWVTHLLKGAFLIRPSQARYTETWDVHTVLQYSRQSAPNAELDLKQLTHKTTMLILIATAARGQELHLMDIQHVSMANGVVTITIHTLTSRANNQDNWLFPHTQQITVCAQ